MYHAAFDGMEKNQFNYEQMEMENFTPEQILLSFCVFVVRAEYERIQKYSRLIPVRVGTPDGKIMANELFLRSVSLKRGDPFPWTVDRSSTALLRD